MWAPGQVVDKHKKRASCVWLMLLAMILSYAVWLLVGTVHKRENPTVSLRLERDRYLFPTISVCFLAGDVGYGCDSWLLNCAGSAWTSILGGTGFDVGDDNADDDADAESASTINEAYNTSCIDIRLSDISETDEELGFLIPRISLQVVWAPTLAVANLSIIAAEDYAQQISESVFVYFTDPAIPDPLGNHNLSTFVGALPYARIPAGNATSDHVRTSITMEMTESVTLDDGASKSYFAGSISSNKYIIEGGLYGGQVLDIDQAMMLVDLYQSELTHTLRKEIDPLEWAELVGNIGGTWEFLLILWGLLFIARQDEPKLKGRNLKKSARRGVEGVVKGAQSVASTVSRVNQRPAVANVADEEAPTWDTAAHAPAARSWNFGAIRAFGPAVTGPAPTGFRAPSADSAMGPVQSSFFGGSSSNQIRFPVLDESYTSSNSVLERASIRVPVPDDIPRPSQRPM